MRLYYFTESYPYGVGEQWKTNELRILVKEFEEVIVVPFSYAGNYDHPVALPDGVHLLKPLFRSEKFTKTDLIKLTVSRFLFRFLAEFFKKRVFLNKNHFLQWLFTSIRINKLDKHPTISGIIRHGTVKDVLYFFWGRGAADLLPFIKLGHFNKVFVRFHGYDLYEARNFGYIPYRAKLLQAIDIGAPCSVAGYNHLSAHYPKAKKKLQVVRLGSTPTTSSSQPSTDGRLRIVSCAFLLAVKRIHLIIEAIALCEFPVEFYHIGDGPEMDDLKRRVKKLGIEDKVIFVGKLPTDEVLSFYNSISLDVFLNVSESEGVPVSIMEALSVGLPVMATDVGGNGEIVVEGCGRLMESNPTPQQVSHHLKWFYNLPAETKQLMRHTAKEKFNSNWNSEKLSYSLAGILKSVDE